MMIETDNSKNKKKVLMVHNFYQIGGGEHTVFQNEVQLLRDHGHKVVEYTRSNDELKESKLKLLLSPFSTIWSFKTYREVKKIIENNKIDVVHCHNTFPLISPSVYYAAIKCKVPVIQTIHNFRFLCPNGIFFCSGKICEKCKEKDCFSDAINNRCYRSSRIQTLIVVVMLKFHRAIQTYKKINYIFLTEFNKEKFSGLIDINGKNVFVKPNFVNEEREGKGDVKEKVFVFAGRLDDVKGIPFLLEAWTNMPKDYKLRIFGAGPYENEVCQAQKMHNNIMFMGFQPHEVVLEELRNATAMLFLSCLYEGFPMTISESFSVGCPVVSTNIGNQASLIKESCGGVQFDLKELESFKTAIEKIVENREQYSENARHYFETHLTADENYKRLVDIYDMAK